MQHKASQVEMAPNVKVLRWLALVSNVTLLTWMALWYFVIADDQQYSLLFVFVIYLLPLILPLKGIIQAKPYTHAWASFVILWYFLHSITVMYAEPDYLILAIVEFVLATLMFIGCSMFARLRGQELGSSLPKLSKVMEQEKEYFEGERKNER